MPETADLLEDFFGSLDKDCDTAIACRDALVAQYKRGERTLWLEELENIGRRTFSIGWTSDHWWAPSCFFEALEVLPEHLQRCHVMNVSKGVVRSLALVAQEMFLVKGASKFAKVLRSDVTQLSCVAGNYPHLITKKAARQIENFFCDERFVVSLGQDSELDYSTSFLLQRLYKNHPEEHLVSSDCLLKQMEETPEEKDKAAFLHILDDAWKAMQEKYGKTSFDEAHYPQEFPKRLMAVACDAKDPELRAGAAKCAARLFQLRLVMG